MKLQDVLVSCVIPTHNRVELLPRAIQSVQNQTHQNIEIIVVSDGSTDGTAEMMKKLCEKDGRIRFIHYAPARGGNIARNTGIEAAKGAFVAFLDDDDEWFPEKIEKQLNIMADPEVGLVYTGVKIIYAHEKITYSFLGKHKGDLSEKILLENCIGTTSTVMLRKDILEKTGLFDVDLNALQDYDLWIRVCQHCKVGVVDQEMINYYNYTGKKQVSADTQKYINALDYLNDKYRAEFSRLDKKQMKEKKINEIMLLSNKAMRNGDRKLARFYLKQAMQISPSMKMLIYLMTTYAPYTFSIKMRSIHRG